MGIVSEIFFPTSCAFCNRASKEPFCKDCLKKMILSNGEKAKFLSLFETGDVYCFGKYVGILKSAFVEYKFHGKIWLGKRFAEMIFETFGEILTKKKYDYLVYVPVSREGFKKRGFDQCEEIAKVLSKLTGIKLLNAIECSSLKNVQSKLTRKGRTQNVQGKFCISTSGIVRLRIKGSNIILLDDILTTGSTLKECGELLLNAGANKTDALVFATGRADS